jgi:tRNA threonylcarbamoyladenosine biosynthesis protein TsaE
MEKTLETNSASETKKLGHLLARELRGGETIALTGDLGSGKTTLTQGLLEGLGAEGPFTSPTFVVMKEYKLQKTSYKFQVIYHIDAYRVDDKDILDLGWKEITSGTKNVVIVEWANRINEIIPENSVMIDFQWLDEKKRRIKVTRKK